MKKLFLLLFFNFLFLSAFNQGDSCKLRISLLTCTPGAELYSTFGHTAIRVQDTSNGTDLVFNYGTFEFGPDFYTKFVRGKLLYFLSVENFEDFLYQYRVESRSAVEQVVQMDCMEKQKLVAALHLNAKEENRYYRYDFLFDNCTTRAGDMIVNNTSSPTTFKNILPENIPSFRNLIHSYLDAGHQYWSKLGIDLLLGAKLDRKVSNREAMFLPDYLLKGFDSAVVKGHPLVTPPQTVLALPSPLQKNPFFTPFVVLSIFLVAYVGISLIRTRIAGAMLSILDFLFFFVLGLAGILLLFMWFGTDHKVCANNYNLFWALPTHSIMAFFVHSNSNSVKKYFRFVSGLTLLLILAWFFLPQQMNNALIPVILLILYRSWSLSKKQPTWSRRN